MEGRSRLFIENENTRYKPGTEAAQKCIQIDWHECLESIWLPLLWKMQTTQWIEVKTWTVWFKEILIKSRFSWLLIIFLEEDPGKGRGSELCLFFSVILHFDSYECSEWVGAWTYWSDVFIVTVVGGFFSSWMHGSELLNSLKGVNGCNAETMSPLTRCFKKKKRYSPHPSIIGGKGAIKTTSYSGQWKSLKVTGTWRFTVDYWGLQTRNCCCNAASHYNDWINSHLQWYFIYNLGYC